MDILTVLLSATIVVNLSVTVWLLVVWRRQAVSRSSSNVEAALANLKAELISGQMDGLLALRKTLDSANETMNQRLAEGTSTLDRRMGIISEIENKLGELSAQAKNIETIGGNIQSLSNLLRPPKLRGILGEMLLDNLLGQILPKGMYEMQYSLRGGQRVDAVVKLGDRLLAIDSKFPLESFQRLQKEREAGSESAGNASKEFAQVVRKHIDSICTKYVRPEEQTTDFAVMYIPAEAVYYEFISDESNDNLQYSLAHKVIPSSPGHLYGFLASLAAVYVEAGLTGDHRKLIHGLQELVQSVDSLKKLNERMNGSLRSAMQNLDRSRGEIDSMDGRLRRLIEPGDQSEAEDAVNITSGNPESL
ncbi:MAG TPA: DNA recombination protein RmuC [candidate division Zixibacteria bacterium]|nr:DNA recombination protein RmuC [candidate division Zixibacteria bacterium]